MKSVEQKLIEKVLEVLTSDETIMATTEGRVYSSHISTIQEPSFPAVSVHLLDSLPRFECADLVDISFQIDSWFPRKTSNVADVLEMNKLIRGLLQRASISDTVIGLKVQQIYEETSGPVLYEEDTDLLHYPKRYRAVVV